VFQRITAVRDAGEAEIGLLGTKEGIGAKAREPKIITAQLRRIHRGSAAFCGSQMSR